MPAASNRKAAALRPTLLFIPAFALSITPHEAAHAVAGYLLGFDCTLYQMWVDPDAAMATPRQLVLIAMARPLFSLAMGLAGWFLYRYKYRSRPSGLFVLLFSIVGLYSFLGPVAAAAFGGDFNIALRFMHAPSAVIAAISLVGAALLAVMMYFAGRELVTWVPLSFGGANATLCAAVAPWLIGTPLALLVYLPLPRQFVGPNLAGSAFWLFAVAGAAFGARLRRSTNPMPSVRPSDLIVTALAVLIVRFLVHGVRLAH